MNARIALSALICVWATSALPQGYAGLGTVAEGFAFPQQETRLEFPLDHGPHPDFRIEWWYLTANLMGEDGADYGIQWTLFRSALAPGEAESWQSPQIWMAHAAVTSEDQHLFAERIARGGVGQAGVQSMPFEAWIDNWVMRSSDETIEKISLSADGRNFSYDLALSADGPLILHGDHGYSVKSASGQASHYYSQPHYQVSGTIELPDGPVKITGHGWLDREWSSQPLAEDQSGWDWFSLSFGNGEKLMGFVLRSETRDFTSGTWISADGTAEPLTPGSFKATPLKTSHVKGREIPTRWQVSLPAKRVSVEVQALNPQSWMGTSFSYWEGPVTVTGSHSGKGYLEMTGYE
ncbi:lipocalin-like domain-containing protein [Leisingera sp. ANG-DT]|uniref:lipocalin-like domain-containing protein n=1 Tax=Leisingera sp. ANG-DT TaxID=1577897 RepID=UPI00057F38EC|nr:lipocalin-like domain-containing protein [Leisingera sp. ANG-DT]KIC19452.1 iron ABC transporter permease [Leisingera sp. ANG-DT]